MSRSSRPHPDSRRQIARDLIIFQAKLWVEGFKDVVLVPLSLGAALVDLVLRRSGPRGTLHALMRAGVRFEKWIDLYGTLDDRSQSSSSDTSSAIVPALAPPRRAPSRTRAELSEASVKK